MPTPPAGFARGKGYDYAIVVVGEIPYAEKEGDNINNLNMMEPYPELIKDICSDVACVVVMVSGRPLVVEPYLGYMDSFVAAWLPAPRAAPPSLTSSSATTSSKASSPALGSAPSISCP